ncbi:MAG: Ig-like domain-containing protein, partial [Deltaproteobacteria bacterium]
MKMSTRGLTAIVLTLLVAFSFGCDKPKTAEEQVAQTTGGTSGTAPVQVGAVTLAATETTGRTANGSESYTLVALVTDPSGHPISDQPVTFSILPGNSGLVRMNPPTGTTGVDGSASCQITDINNNDDTVTLSAFCGGVSATTPVDLYFIGTGTGTGGGNVLTFTHTPTPVVADGSSLATVTATLVDSSSPPVPQQGELITLTTNGSAQIISQNPVQTDANGDATFTLINTTAETVTLTASGGGATDVNVSQSFTEVPVATVVLAAPQVAGLTANGSDAYEIIAQVLDANNQPLKDRQVSFSASGYVGLVAMPPFATTGTDGTATTTVSDINSSDDTVTLNASASGVSATTPVVLTFIGTGSGTGGGNILAFTHTPAPIVADGSTAATITVSLTDSSSPPVPQQGELITLSQNGSAQVTSQNPVQTDASGVATFTVVDSVPESIFLEASGGGATGVTITQIFTAVPVASVNLAAPQVAGQLANGSASYTVIALVLDASGQPLSGRQVSFSASGYGGLVAFTPFGTTGTDGTVSTTVKDINANDDTVDIDATSGGVSTLSPVTLYFTGTGSGTGGGNILSFTHTPSPVLANGSATATITARLTDASLNPLQGETITLSSTGSAQITSQNPVQTDASGDVTFLVTNMEAETVTLKASGGDATDVSVPQLFTLVPVDSVLLASIQTSGLIANGS